MHPSLTTVRQPLREMGQSAAQTLLRLIRTGQMHPEQQSILVSPTFMKRHSSGKIAAS
jgi:DNA-binding LacI/PurR family transcriptional regulator